MAEGQQAPYLLSFQKESAGRETCQST